MAPRERSFSPPLFESREGVAVAAAGPNATYQPDKPEPPKSVRFSDSVRVRIVEHTKIGKEKKSKLWYTKQEQREIRNSCMTVVEWMSAMETFTSSHSLGEEGNIEGEDLFFCTRGLERYTAYAEELYRERRQSLLSEMTALLYTGAGPDEVALLASAHSQPFVREALELAQRDALAAMRYQNGAIRGNIASAQSKEVSGPLASEETECHREMQGSSPEITHPSLPNESSSALVPIS